MCLNAGVQVLTTLEQKRACIRLQTTNTTWGVVDEEVSSEIFFFKSSFSAFLGLLKANYLFFLCMILIASLHSTRKL